MRHLEVTTYLPCPNMCSYCPQNALLSVYNGEKVLSLDNFELMLKNVPKASVEAAINIALHIPTSLATSPHTMLPRLIEPKNTIR